MKVPSEICTQLYTFSVIIHRYQQPIFFLENMDSVIPK